MSDIEVKIGLETHVQLDTDTKLFCGCPNEQDAEPNTNVCETCLGHPGSKPRLNAEVLRTAVQTSLALRCGLNRETSFSRKTYFYPDMSKNYQITQYELPVGEEGNFELKIEDEKREIGIRRLHIEEDPAKLKHSGGKVSSADYTLVDYNRAGTPLLEIVTEPDFRSPEEARAYLNQLVRMLEYLEAYSSDSGFTVKSDANISIEGGSRVEVKNITGTKEVEKALNYEISRQKQLSERGGSVEQETRSFNPDTGATDSMRQKETEEDYGYISDPDLTKQKIDQKMEDKLQDQIPELPREKFERIREEYGIPEKQIEALVSSSEISDAFESLADDYGSDLVASWLTGELKKTLNYVDLSLQESGIEEKDLEYLISLLESEKITERNAEQVLREIVESGDAKSVVEQQDLLRAEQGEVLSAVENVVETNQDAVEDYMSGDEGALNFLVGQVMQETGGKADPRETREMIEDSIDES